MSSQNQSCRGLTEFGPVQYTDSVDAIVCSKECRKVIMKKEIESWQKSF